MARQSSFYYAVMDLKFDLFRWWYSAEFVCPLHDALSRDAKPSAGMFLARSVRVYLHAFGCVCVSV